MVSPTKTSLWDQHCHDLWAQEGESSFAHSWDHTKVSFPPVATPVQSLVRNLGPSSADNCILIELNSSQQSSHPITTLQSCPEIALQVIYKSCSQVKRTKINFSLISKLKSFEIRFFFSAVIFYIQNLPAVRRQRKSGTWLFTHRQALFPSSNSFGFLKALRRSHFLLFICTFSTISVYWSLLSKGSQAGAAVTKARLVEKPALVEGVPPHGHKMMFLSSWSLMIGWLDCCDRA